MAGRIRDDSIAQIREATDIVALVGEYVSLRPAGGTRMKGLCPFHQEKTPSFTVESVKGVYHCFGCSEGGDAIDFLQKQASLSFVEATERLAQRAGIELRYEGRAVGERGSLGRKSRLVAAHAEAVAFYHQLLLSSPEARPARGYLSSRGFDRAAAERFKLGWAPGDQWEALVTHLRGKGYGSQELIDAGLAKPGNRGLRDAFHGRVLFPIFDVAGDPVAFGARILDLDDQGGSGQGGPEHGGSGRGADRGPKYLNTAETVIWRKGQVLYGLNWAKVPIVQASFAVVVEGYTDVIACHRAGVTQAVATCGTALREDHFKLLARFTEKIVLAFDADTAGGNAAGRGVNELPRPDQASGGTGFAFLGSSMGQLIADRVAALTTYVLVMPAGQDPADLVVERGGAAFRALIDQAQPLVGWWLDRKLADFDLRNPEGKVRAARELVPLLRSIPDSLQRTEYARSVVQRLHLDEREYLAMVAGQQAPSRVRVGEPKEPPRTRTPQLRVECEALKFALQHSDWTAETAVSWEADWFTAPSTKASFAAMLKAGGPGAPLEAVLEAAANETERRFLRGLAVEAFAAEENRGYAGEVFRRLEEFRLTRVIDQLKGTLQRMNPVERPDEYTHLFEELIAFEARRRALREPRPEGDGDAILQRPI